MDTSCTSRKVLWVAGSLVTIALVVVISVWQWQTARLRNTLVDDSLLSDIPCAAPCWQGIVPGKTSRSQALQILRNSPYVRDDSLEEAGTAETGGVTWWWSIPGRRLQPSLVWQDGIVREITLGLTYDLTVHQIVSKFGPPESLDVGVGGVPEHQYWIVDLYYPGKGIQFKAYTSEYSSLLEPSTEVGVAIYFVPSSLEERVANIYSHGENDISGRHVVVSNIMSLMRPWKGYGDLFEVYYKSPQELESQE